MRLVALDPGTTETGYVVINGTAIVEAGVRENEDLRKFLYEIAVNHHCAIEMVASYGMAVGREVFETCVWIGRFYEVFASQRIKPALVYRKDVKLHLCGTSKAKDLNVRRAILDLYPSFGGGANPQIGTKGHPGPLYGVKSHAIAALAVALTYAHKAGVNIIPRIGE
jgi:hypothetical protein